MVCCVQIEFHRKPASIHRWLFSQRTVSEQNLSDSMTSPIRPLWKQNAQHPNVTKTKIMALQPT